MVDLVDRAQEAERLNTEDALTSLRLRVEAEKPAEKCKGCGGEIGEARRKAMPQAGRCIDCEEARERQRKLFYRRSGAR
ncbi:MAG: TraR/DksA C4-type zinc finger protein [Parvibaculum sedimenti]|uniref:TraR/DksA C4-type zinc finger protein n=1 Tax=Parvibaculum sedimenti TaxID=2608632 RepID=UPI003BB7D113